ncbi:MAG: acyl carrier protein [Cyanobacteria bacterium P01_A01_bin.84]
MSFFTPAYLNQNKKITVSTSSKGSSFQLLVREVDNFPDYSDRICQNWLKAHKTESPGDKTIQKYTKIVSLLQDIDELIEEIKTTIKSAQLQKLEISEIVGNIVSDCLDIDPKQVTPTANLVEDLGIDSLEWQELLITLEEKFAIIISDEIARALVTVQQLIDYIVSIVRKENISSPQLQPKLTSSVKVFYSLLI